MQLKKEAMDSKMRKLIKKMWGRQSTEDDQREYLLSNGLEVEKYKYIFMGA